jgi:hypothetical protein
MKSNDLKGLKEFIYQKFVILFFIFTKPKFRENDLPFFAKLIEITRHLLFILIIHKYN